MASWEAVATELRALWNSQHPIDPGTVGELAPELTRALGFGDSNVAYQNLEDLLIHHSDDSEIGSLMAALGLLRHHLVRTGNISERLTDYGMHVLEPPRSERMVRRYAEAGVEKLAKEITANAYQFDLTKPSVSIKLLPHTAIGAEDDDLIDASFKVQINFVCQDEELASIVVTDAGGRVTLLESEESWGARRYDQKGIVYEFVPRCYRNDDEPSALIAVRWVMSRQPTIAVEFDKQLSFYGGSITTTTDGVVLWITDGS